MGVVLFDLDGVLTSRDTFGLLVRRRLVTSPWRLLLALPALALLPVAGDRPRLRAPVARSVVRVALAGESLTAVQSACRVLGAEFAATPAWLHREAVRRASEHLRRGDRVLVITATEEGLARTLLDSLGLEKVEVLASRLAPSRLGTRLSPHLYGAAKVEALLAAGIPPPWKAMYTDSVADFPVLREVERAVLVNPSRRLLTLACSLTGQVEVERWT